MLTSAQIRDQFIRFFTDKHAHTHVPSSPVVPLDDPTLLFANAGMNQFKDVFLATGRREYTRAVNTQKCIRAGGKHNDLDDVGKDTYHHTFFEMLGNWSFGDYFKKEAIDWAWELLVESWGLDPERLHATYFEGDEAENLKPDNEARELWARYLPAERIHPGNKKDNFWEMGDTGPCGPCSELHYDGTPGKTGGPLVNQDDPDVIEIWNLVFIQFNRGTDDSLSSLPAKHVDTGMGFERIVRVLQNKTSNYDTDVFQPIFDAIQKVTGAPPYNDELHSEMNIAYRVIADHIRTLTFALTDGAHCGNDGRNYVLRRILRRAVRYGRQVMNVSEPFFYKLVPTVVDAMGDAFPELKKNPQAVADELREEEESFRRTLDRGIELFNEAASHAHADGDGRRAMISGEDAFKLYDTYGFPLDLTVLMAEERDMTVDEDGYDRLMKEAQEKSRAAGGKVDYTAALNELAQKEDLPDTEFHGYERCQLDAVTKRWIYDLSPDGYRALESVSAGQRAAVIVERTPFYAESGGQVGDTGTIETQDGACFHVEDTIKVGDIVVHLGEVEKGELAASPDNEIPLRLRVSEDRRALIAANHTATHIMNRALRSHVSREADQRGSLVDDEKTRFDFSHNAAMTIEQIEAVEKQVNDDIAADLPVHYDYAPQEDALKINGLRAVFGEKYPPRVRVVSIGPKVADLLELPGNDDWAKYSIEFCGGTHLAKTGEAKRFAIVGEEAVGKGIRRITALTGDAAKSATETANALLEQIRELKNEVSPKLANAYTEIVNAVDHATLPVLLRNRIRDELAEFQKQLKAQQKKQQKEAAGNVVDEARKIAEEITGDVIVSMVPGADGQSLRKAMDVIKKKRPEAAMLLAANLGDKAAFLAAVPQSWIDRGLKAGDWVREVAKAAGGGGGGRPDMAQAGGKDPSKLAEALDVAREFVKSKV